MGSPFCSRFLSGNLMLTRSFLILDGAVALSKKSSGNVPFCCCSCVADVFSIPLSFFGGATSSALDPAVADRFRGTKTSFLPALEGVVAEDFLGCSVGWVFFSCFANSIFSLCCLELICTFHTASDRTTDRQSTQDN
uniref:Putative secreted peptide n=1 Tax=Anopheles braziliensis TaxID=58242 RepID=A0A2M3ZTD8_9DIPT